MAGEDQARIFDALDSLTPLLAELGIEYAVGGSMASSHFGQPRFTGDADLFVDLPASKLDRLLVALKDSFYAPEQPARDAVRHHGMFNIVHLATMSKIDLHVSRGDTLDREELARRRRVALGGQHELFVASPEVIVLRKLDWYRRGNFAAEHQWHDIVGVLKAQRGRLDTAFLERMAAELKLDELLARATAEAERGPSP